MSQGGHAGEDISTENHEPTSALQWTLQVWKQEENIDQIALPQPSSTAASLTLGRNETDADVVLNHGSISRAHARIVVVPPMKNHEQTMVKIKDLNSQNGTFVNGEQMKALSMKDLKEGDKFKLGKSSRIFILQKAQVPSNSTTATATVTATSDNVGSEGRKAPNSKEEEHQYSENDVNMDPEKMGLPAAFGATTGKAGTKAVSGIAEEFRGATKFEYGNDNGDEMTENETYKQQQQQQPEEKSEIMGNSTEKIKLARDNNIPIARCAVLRGHERTVSAIGIDRAGARVVTGSLDHHLKIYDFGGMDSEHRPFKDICPEEGNVIKAVDFSPSGDSFIVATGSRQPQIYDRDGNWQLTFVKGDQYLMDLRHTRGHIGEVTHAEWHPTNKNMTLTSAIEGTIRWWDLEGKTAFDGELFCEHAVRLKDERGIWTGASACTFAPNGFLVLGGGFDGSIQMFDKRTACTRPSKVIRDAHAKFEHAVTSLDFQPKETGTSYTFSSRGVDGNVKVWDMRKPIKPLVTITNVPTLLHSANVCWSPDGKILTFGNSAGRNKGNGYFACIDFLKSQQQTTLDVSQVWTEDSGSFLNDSVVLHAQACENDSLPVVAWHPEINQIFLGGSDATTRVLFDEQVSTKGALLSSKKKAKSKLDTIDMAAPIIMSGERPRRIRPKDITPGVVAYDERTGKRKWHSLRRDTIASKKPEQPSTEVGDGELHIGSRTHLQHAMKEQHKNALVSEDPRDALLKYESAAKKSKLVGRAYAQTQPNAQYESKTLEEEFDGEDNEETQ